MKVLMITGDKNFSTSARYALQRSVVDALEVVYWGPLNWWPKIPKKHFDVITTQDPFWRGLVAWHIARKTGAKLNLQVHTDLSAQSFFRRLIARFLLRRADSIRVVSEKIKMQVQVVRCKGQVNVLPIFVDIGSFKDLTPKPHPKKTILWIGRFEPEKDPSCALSVLKEVRESGIDAKMIMLGKGSLENALRNYARNLPVEFPGWQDPKPYLQISDVVLCTSKHESWGASIVEALAASVPVVAPDVGIAREAGATIVPRSDLGMAVADVLHSGKRGELKISLINAEEWAKCWRETLLAL